MDTRTITINTSKPTLDDVHKQTFRVIADTDRILTFSEYAEEFEGYDYIDDFIDKVYSNGMIKLLQSIEQWFVLPEPPKDFYYIAKKYGGKVEKLPVTKELKVITNEFIVNDYGEITLHPSIPIHKITAKFIDELRQAALLMQRERFSERYKTWPTTKN